MALKGLPSAPAKRTAVRAMFDRIAPRYDLLNRLLTGGLDQRWRRRALREAGVGPGDRVLDLACGTGDLCEQIAELGATAIGVDFAREMLRGAEQRGVRAWLVQGNAESLPVPSASVDVVSCGFALRNFGSLERAIQEIARVLRPGGRIALLEVDRPRSATLRALHSLHFDHLVPRIGGWLSDRDAYRYLPQSTVYLPPSDELRSLLEKAGFAALEQRRLFLGSAQLWLGERRAG